MNSQFTFKEVAYIKKGSANLNCQYTTTLNGNKISGTWSDPSSDKGTIELNNKIDTKISNSPESVGTTIPTKSSFPDPNIKSPSGETVLPVNIIGSWTTYGNIKKMGRMSFWQKGDEFVAINCYPILNTDTGEYSGRWRCFKGEGKLDGRKIECKFSDSTTDGSKKETDFFYWYGTISGDNSEITYYTIWNGATESVIGLPFRRIQ